MQIGVRYLWDYQVGTDDGPTFPGQHGKMFRADDRERVYQSKLQFLSHRRQRRQSRPLRLTYSEPLRGHRQLRPRRLLRPCCNTFAGRTQLERHLIIQSTQPLTLRRRREPARAERGAAILQSYTFLGAMSAAPSTFLPGVSYPYRLLCFCRLRCRRHLSLRVLPVTRVSGSLAQRRTNQAV